MSAEYISLNTQNQKRLLAWQHTCEIPALKILKQENSELKTSVGYIKHAILKCKRAKQWHVASQYRMMGYVCFLRTDKCYFWLWLQLGTKSHVPNGNFSLQFSDIISGWAVLWPTMALSFKSLTLKMQMSQNVRSPVPLWVTYKEVETPPYI